MDSSDSRNGSSKQFYSRQTAMPSPYERSAWYDRENNETGANGPNRQLPSIRHLAPPESQPESINDYYCQSDSGQAAYSYAAPVLAPTGPLLSDYRHSISGPFAVRESMQWQATEDRRHTVPQLPSGNAYYESYQYRPHQDPPRQQSEATYPGPLYRPQLNSAVNNGYGPYGATASHQPRSLAPYGSLGYEARQDAGLELNQLNPYRTSGQGTLSNAYPTLPSSQHMFPAAQSTMPAPDHPPRGHYMSQPVQSMADSQYLPQLPISGRKSPRRLKRTCAGKAKGHPQDQDTFDPDSLEEVVDDEDKFCYFTKYQDICSDAKPGEPLRQCISHLFGRNKKETNAAKHLFPVVHRRCYQRCRYGTRSRAGRARGLPTYIEVQRDLFHIVMCKEQEVWPHYVWKVLFSNGLKKAIGDVENGRPFVRPRRKKSGSSEGVPAKEYNTTIMDRAWAEVICRMGLQNMHVDQQRSYENARALFDHLLDNGPFEKNNPITLGKMEDIPSIEFLPSNFEDPGSKRTSSKKRSQRKKSSEERRSGAGPGCSAEDEQQAALTLSSLARPPPGGQI